MKQQLKQLQNHLYLLFFFMLTSACSQEKEFQQIDELLSSVYKKEMPGASVLISKQGKVIFEKQYGIANLELNIPLSSYSRFAIGSITKQFTAAAIFLLEEQGKLKLSDALSNFLPEFDKDKYPIKIVHLLSHTSGLPTDNRNKDISIGLKYNISPIEILSIIKKEPLVFEPGSKYSYSNNGYILLGLIIEKASGLNYADFLDKHVFTPLQMDNTEIGFYEDIVKNRASGYTQDDQGRLINASYHAFSFSAGAIISTPSDLNKWATALFNYKIVNKNSLSQMLQKYKLTNGELINSGFGWEINTVRSVLSYEHTGYEPGYKSSSIYLPKEKIYIIITQNTEVNSPTPASIHIASVLLMKPYPRTKDAKSLTTSKLEKFIGTYQMNNEEKRMIGLDDESNLYYKAPGGVKRSLQVLNDNTLFLTQGYRQLSFEKDSKMGFAKFTYSNRNYQTTGIKISNEIAKENQVLNLDVDTLRKYEGTFKSEQFTMVISIVNDKLFAQPEGSDQLELLPKGNHQFFIKEIGAEIEFDFQNGADVKQINILLEGNKMIGIKQ